MACSDAGDLLQQPAITTLSQVTRSGGMECGFGLPSRGQAATLQNMRLLAQHVEALGLDCVGQ